MKSPQSRHLVRLWRSVALPNLHQGSTLTIRSNLPTTHLLLQPEWRDSGHAELKQIFSKTDRLEKETDLTVKLEKDQKTSLGRTESHVSIDLHPQSPEDRPVNDAENIPESVSVPSHFESLPVDKVILDDWTIVPDSAEFSPAPAGTRRVEYHDGIAHVTATDSQQQEEPGTFLRVQIPEKINLICELNQGGNISINGKVEGDVKLFTSDGDVSVTKLRGHVVDLENGGADNVIYASTLLEAQNLSVKTSGRFRAKQIHGSTVDIAVKSENGAAQRRLLEDDDDDGSLVDISALFVMGQGGATIETSHCRPARRAVRVKSHHGPLRVETDHAAKPLEEDALSGKTYPLVELGGVNGNCEVSIEKTNLPDEDSSADWTSASVHMDSLSPNSVSLVSADRGEISITLDRKVEADVRLLSTLSDECLVESGALLAEEEDPRLVVDVLCNLPKGSAPSEIAHDRISIQTKAFTSRQTSFVSDHVDYKDGWVENKSQEPDSRFERKVQSETGFGKIRLDGAADQALRGFSQHRNATDKADDDESNYRPLIAVVGTGGIVLETLSWLGAIARRYGLDEDSDRDLGRTASRRGRSIAPTRDNE